MWYNLRLEGANPSPGYLYKLGVYTESVTVPIQMPDSTIKERFSGTPQGSVISPILANLFMHYAFDRWMKTKNPENPWARYADDGVIHCKTKEEAHLVLSTLKHNYGDVF